ncbi:MAG: hypothetical protein LBK47_07380 [Prevotellaceae bacterium]|nr:hypothetical protein [Prevotellaceae bacterium]
MAAPKVKQAKAQPAKPEAKAQTKEQAASSIASASTAHNDLPRITVGTGKRRVVVSYKNLTEDVLELFKQKYPYGWSDYVMKINKSDADFFYAVMLETDDVAYLVKVDVKIDSRDKLDEDKDLVGGDGDIADSPDADELPAEDDDDESATNDNDEGI